MNKLPAKAPKAAPKPPGGAEHQCVQKPSQEHRWIFWRCRRRNCGYIMAQKLQARGRCARRTVGESGREGKACVGEWEGGPDVRREESSGGVRAEGERTGSEEEGGKRG
ncbi:unnamed protein product [Urochloa humidicola]